MFEELNGNELMLKFKELAFEAASLGLPTVSIPKRFRTRDIALKRLEKLNNAISAEKTSMKQNIPMTATSDDNLEVYDEPKQKKEKKPVARIRNTGSEIVKECKVNGGTNRAAALNYLYERLGEQCPAQSIREAVYDGSEISNNAFHTVMKALTRDVTNSNARYEIKRVKDGRNISYGLYSKK
jgi:hypothetical protein